MSEPVCQSYFVSATPRSGSSLLAEALEFTTIAGRPREYFDPGHEKSWWTRLGITADTEYVAIASPYPGMAPGQREGFESAA